MLEEVGKKMSEEQPCERCGELKEWEEMDYWFDEWICDECFSLEIQANMKIQEVRK